MSGFGDNFVEATMDALQEDTDVDWRPRVPQWPAIGDTMATAIQSRSRRPGDGQGRARRRAEAHRADDAWLTMTRSHHCDSRSASPCGEVAADTIAASVLARRERRFAAALLAPAFLALLATTTFPLLFLIWTSAFRMDLAMPFADGFVGLRELPAICWPTAAFWSSLRSA